MIDKDKIVQNVSVEIDRINDAYKTDMPHMSNEASGKMYYHISRFTKALFYGAADLANKDGLNQISEIHIDNSFRGLVKGKSGGVFKRLTGMIGSLLVGASVSHFTSSFRIEGYVASQIEVGLMLGAVSLGVVLAVFGFIRS